MKRTLRILTTLLCLTASLLLLLSAFSDRVSPLTSVWFSFLGMFFPFILAFHLFVLAICALFKQWRNTILSVLVLLICSGSIATYFPFHSQTKDIPDDCIKIITYNVMRFEYLKPHDKSHTNEVVQFIVDSEADIICLQEYGISTNNKNKLSLADLKKAFKSTPYHHIQHVHFPYEGETYGLVIFSKFPILRTEKLPYDSDFNASFLAELDINGRRVTLINNHLESNKLTMEERTGYDGLTRDPNMTELKSFTSAMFKRLTPAFQTRAKQADLIAQTIKETKNPYVIVCGDFNDTPISYTHHKIKGDLKDAFVESGRGMGITYNKYRFLFRIDYILHSKNMKAYNCTVGKLKNSDHYPLTTYLQFID